MRWGHRGHEQSLLLGLAQSLREACLVERHLPGRNETTPKRGGISSKGFEKLDAELKTYLDYVLQTLE